MTRWLHAWSHAMHHRCLHLQLHSAKFTVDVCWPLFMPTQDTNMTHMHDSNGINVQASACSYK